VGKRDEIERKKQEIKALLGKKGKKWAHE